MSYLGNEPQFTQYPSKFFNGNGTAQTVALDYAPPNAAAVLVFIDGVRQDTSAYTLAGTNLTFTGSVPSGTNNVQVVHMGLILDVGVPGDDTVTTVKIQDDAVTTDKIQDDAVTADKLANAINTSIAANTAKVTNATHTGDVTGATALTIAADAVDIAMLSATGTASATTFLRGDNAWASAAAGLNSVQTFTSSGTWTRPSGITKVIMEVQGAGGGGGSGSGNYAAGGGGGGYAKKFLDVSSISTSTITVGAGGGAGSSGAGSSGGSTSWADGTNTVTGSGGGGGVGSGVTASSSGSGTGGDINIPGGNCNYELPSDSVLGWKGTNAGSNSHGASRNATGYGGGGGHNSSSGTAGTGSGGIVIVWEYK